MIAVKEAPSRTITDQVRAYLAKKGFLQLGDDCNPQTSKAWDSIAREGTKAVAALPIRAEWKASEDALALAEDKFEDARAAVEAGANEVIAALKAGKGPGPIAAKVVAARAEAELFGTVIKQIAEAPLQMPGRAEKELTSVLRNLAD